MWKPLSMPGQVQIKRLGSDEAWRLSAIADGVFDDQVQPHLATKLLQDKGSVLVVATDSDVVVGMCSAFVHLRADKQPELYVSEIGVAAPYQQRGIGGQMMAQIEAVAVEEGCSGCWLLTDLGNVAANALYKSRGGWNGPSEQVMYSLNLQGPEATS